MSTDKAPRPGDTLGDRIKKYEAVTRPFLTPNTPVIIRVDGKAFHTFTRHMNRPFDLGLIHAMRQATARTAREMQGFKLAYTQSDEAQFMITDTDTFETQGWLGYNVNKIVSVTASAFTAHFNIAAQEHISELTALAMFDARAFSVPAEDAPNAFIWRQRDWERNSLQMLARHYYSHGKLQGKRHDQIHELLHEYGVNWATDLDPILKNGTWIDRNQAFYYDKMNYEGIEAMIYGLDPVVMAGTD